MSTTITQQQLAQLDYLYKKVITRKIKSDGISTNTIISPANETIPNSDLVKSEQIWSDSAKLYAGPGQPGVPANNVFVQATNIHNRPGIDVVSDLNGRSWNTGTLNWVPPDFNLNFLPLVYHGTTAQNATNTVDYSAYPYVFDYSTGILTFINTVPSYLTSGESVFVNGYVYSGFMGMNKLNGDFSASNITAYNTLYTNNFNVVNGSTFNYNYNNLSNINTLIATNHQVVNLTTYQSTNNNTTGTINVAYNTLSNINTLSKVTTLDIANITTTIPSSNVNMSQKNYINANQVASTTVNVDYLASQSTSTINLSATNLTNVANVNINSANTLFTNSISTNSGNNISFNSKNLNGIVDLNMSGSLNVNGNFFVINTTTCNTDQFTVNNYGTGPALIVNQQNNLANATVAQFMLNSNTALIVNNKGQTAIGGFGKNPSALNYNAQLYVNSPVASNQDSVYIQQDNATYNMLKMITSSTSSCNVVFTGAGKFGIGTTPTARIHVYHADNTSTELLRLSNPLSNNAFVVGADGRVGIGTDPANFTNTLTVKGIIRADNLILGGGSGTTNLITAYGMIAPAGTSYLSFGTGTGNNMDFRNVNIIYPFQIQTTDYGSAVAPAYTFQNNNSTGMFLFDTNKLAFSTGGTEQVRIDNIGNVGIGTQTANNKLSVIGSVGIGTFAGNAMPVAPDTNGLIVAGKVTFGTTTSANYMDVAGNTAIGTTYAGSYQAPPSGAVIEGSVGIGTFGNNLTNKLSVAGRVAVGTYAANNTQAPDANGMIISGKVGINTSSSTNYVDICGNIGIGTGYGGIRNAPTDGMIIQGNVGIGTFGNNLTNKLNVAGAVSIGSYATVNTVAPNANSLIVSGTLGLGTANATNKADIAGSVSIGSNYAGIVSSPDSGLTVQGNVGIGTNGANLANKISVYGKAAFGDYANTNTAAPNPNSMIVSGTVGIGTSTATNKVDVAGNMSIGSNYAGVVSSPDSGLTVQGNVGIGTNGANLSNKLNVAGAVSVGSYATVNTVAPNPNSMIVSGTIGVGTASATNKVDVAGSVSIGSNYAGIVSSPDSGLTVQGNVGIGTNGANLTNKLSVYGKTAFGDYANTNVAAPNPNSMILSGTLGVGTSTATNKVDVAGSVSIGSNYAGIVSSPDSGLTVQGNVGIGTNGANLANKISVYGKAAFGDYANTNVAAPNPNSMIISGTVGIGTSTATNKVDVAGSVSIGSNYAGIVSSPDSGLTVQGNVGIGTNGANLSNKLNVAGAVSVGSYATANTVAPNPNSLIVSGTLGLGTSNATNKADIAGNVSIGSNYAGIVSSPDSGLTVQGNVGIGTFGANLANKISVYGKSAFGDYANTNVAAPNPNSMILSGTLGVGTSTATNKVDVAGSVSIGSNYAGVVSSPDSGLTVQGNVGIGTNGANLSNKLNVAGAVSIGSYATNNTIAPNPNSMIVSGTIGVGTANATNKADIAGSVSIGSNYAGVVSSPNSGLTVEGNVGIGTFGANLTNKLSVYGKTAFGDYANTNVAAPNANSMILSGTLGVGTSTATNKVDVAGSVSIGSNYAGIVSSPDSGLTVQGNVGIGTNGANLANKISVYGKAAFGDYANTNVAAPNANSMIISGTLGVGTSTATNKADIAGSVSIGSNYAGVVSSPDSGLTVQGNVGIGTNGANLSNKLNVAGAVSIGSYATNNTIAPNPNSMIVSGTIGVGTASATNKVDVAGSVSIGSNYAGVVSSPDSGLTVQGNVGIGTFGANLTNKFSVYGKAAFGDYANTNVAAPNPNSIIVSGTLGVGTNTATNKVDVAGSVSIGSNYAGQVSSPDSGLTVQGNVGIGTNGANLTNKLSVAGSVAIGTYAANNTFAGNNNLIISGNIGIGTTAPQYTLDVTPFGSGTINTPNLQVSRIITTPGSNQINMSYSTLSNLNVINTVNVNASGVVNVATATPTYATNFSTASLVVTGGTAISQNLLVGDTTDSSSTTTGSAIISGGVGIAKKLNVGTTITAGTSVVTPNVTTPSIQSSTNTITMNYNRIIDVDTLVVRSNISVLMTGTGTYSNLPTDLVRIDAQTGKILDQYISQNIVRLMGDGTINPALLPVVPSNRSTLLRTSDKVGIGLRNPQQKLHVFGNQCTTGGYVGIGTATPTAPLHIWDQNGTGGAPIIYVKEAGSVDLLGIYGQNSDVTPVMYINGTSNVGINTKPATNSIFALDVTGKMRATTSVRTSALESDSGTINCQNTNFTNMQNVNINYLTVTGSVSLPTTNITTTTTTSVATNTISAATGSSVQMTSGLYITGFDNSLYASSSNFVAGSGGTTNIGLRVNESILAKTIFTISDQRLKTNITFSPSIDDMLAITNIPVHRFNYIGQDQNTIGFIAQEVEQYAPYAVTTTSGPIPNIMKYATVAEENASLLILENHGLNVDDRVKLLIDNVERIATVQEVVDENTFRIDDPIPTGTTVYVYGIIVNDFKVLENGRLIPLIFNGVKMLNSTVTQQQRIIQEMLVRINALEAKVNTI